MRGDAERLILLTSALIIAVVGPAIIIAAIALGKIPLEEAMNSNPMVIVPYKIEKIGWGALWAVVAVSWAVHGSYGLNRILRELVKSEGGRKALFATINVIMVIVLAGLLYTLLFVT